MSHATRSQIRGSTLLLAGQAFAVVAALATQVILVRHLDKEAYGAFAYALSIVAIGEAVSALGMRRGVARFLPTYEERGDLARAAGTLVLALGVIGALGLATVLVVIGLRGTFTATLGSDDEARLLLAILILLAPLQALENLLDGTFAVFARPRAIAARKHVFTPLMRLAVVALVALSDGGSPAVAWGYVATGAAGLIVYGWMLGRVLRSRHLLEPLRRRAVTIPAREVLSFTLPLLTTDLAAALLNSAATILLGVFATGGDVAEFRAVLPVAMTMSYVLSSFGLLFVPLTARLVERGEHAEVDRLYWQTSAWTAVFSFPVFALAFAFADPLTVLLFGERYAGAGGVLAVLVLGHFFTAALGPNGVLLGVYGEVRFVVAANLASVAVNLAFGLALIPVLGALGAAVAATATQIVLNVARQIGLARRTQVRGFAHDLTWLYAVMVWLGAGLLGVAQLLDAPIAAGVALTAAAFAGVLLLARRRLDFAGTFPELMRLPLVGRVLGGARP